MDLGVELDEISHEDLLTLYSKTRDFITLLNTEIETSEVEKKEK